MPVSLPWYARGESSIGNEWARLNAGDQSGGAAIDPSSYTGNRVSLVDAVDLGFDVPAGTKAYKITMVGNEEPQWTQSYGARTELGQHNGGSPPPGGERREFQGDTAWRAYQLMLDTNFSAPGWCALQQNKINLTGNGPLSIGCAGNRLSYDKSDSQAEGSTNNTKTPFGLDPTPKMKPIKICIGVKWSTGSDGWYEIWADAADGQGYRQIKARTNGWTLKLVNGAPGNVGACIGLYRQVSSSTPTSTVYFVGFNLAATRAEAEAAAFFDGGGGVVTPPTTRTLASVDDPITTGADWPSTVGNVTFNGTQAVLNIDSSIATSYMRTEDDIVAGTAGVAMGPVTWAARTSGSGEFWQYLTFEPGTGTNNRFVWIRKTVNSGATVTSDIIETRVVSGGVDNSPSTFNWSALPSGTVYAKTGFLANGTVSFQGSVAGSAFKQIASRTIPSTIDMTAAGFIEIGLKRISGDVVTSNLIVDRVYGLAGAADDTSGPPVVQPAVPQASGLTLTNPRITSGSSPSTGEVQLTVNATVADASIAYTPNATPYGFFYSTDGTTWNQIQTWQSSPTLLVTGIPLDPGDESQTRFYTARYRSNAGTPLLGDYATPQALFITVARSTLTAVKNLDLIRASGQRTAIWDLPDPEEGVTLYQAWLVPATSVIDINTAPTWTGTGTVAGGRVTGPTFTGLSDTTRYRVGVLPLREQL